MKKIPIVFFGSGPVAAKSLELLLENFEIVAVVTKPKPSHHRGDFPVVSIAENNNLTIHTVSNKKELSSLISTNPFKTEVGILIDFGIIVTQDVIDFFPKGIINSHFSLLPEWRGADPITFSILSGQKKTGVSLMLIDEGMDTGKLISQVEYAMPDKITSPQLTERLIKISYNSLVKIIPLWLSGEAHEATQEEVTIAPSKKATYSRKLTKDDGFLDFSKSAEVLEREIRAYIEWPKSHTKLADIDVIITKAIVSNNSGKSGEFSISNDKLLIYCSDKSLEIERLKPAGKSEMDVKSFLAGYSKKILK